MELWEWSLVREKFSFAPPGFVRFSLLPTAYAVGCTLAPLRGCPCGVSEPQMCPVRFRGLFEI